MKLFFTCLLIIYSTFINATEVNYDEDKVPKYKLPNPLVFDDGANVDKNTQWNKRRNEILNLFEKYEYGITPKFNGKITYTVIQENREALNGTAIEQQAEVHIGNVKLNLLMYFPKQGKKNYPVFLGYNFCGNQAITNDTNVLINPNWANKDVFSKPIDHKKAIINNKFTEKSRGARDYRFPVKYIIKKGYALVTLYYGDVDPDFDDNFKNGIHQLFTKSSESEKKNFSSISAWAWGLSRVLDSLVNEPLVDMNKVIVFGHSRLGKAALWAGAQDTRFAMVISNNSGCGGAALSKRKFGETLNSINNQFPHWFNKKFKSYNNKEEKLPLDQNMLIALIAPRPVYIASAEDDRWADPKGEFLSAKNADSVYRLLVNDGLKIKKMPETENPSIGLISYHIRKGPHDLTKYDWEQFIKAANIYVK